MNARHNTPRLFRAAAVAIVGFAMTCGLLILMGGLALPVRAAPMADTVISSDIITDTTWALAGSPYIVSGTVNIYSGTLTISPNVTVRFNRASELVVQGSGRLAAIGTASQPITFTSSVTPTPASCDWDAIRFYSSNNTVRYSTIEYSGWGIDVKEFSNGNDISYNTFRSNGLCASSPVGGAIVGSPDNSTVTYNTFTNNASAIYIAKASANIIAYNIVSGTTQAAIAFAQSGGGATRSSDNQIYGNTIRWSQDVGLLINLGSFNTISQNLIYNNRSNGIWLTNDRNGQIFSNQIYGNAAGLYMTGTQDARLADNFIHDNVTNYGLDYGPNNSGTAMAGNAICRDPSFELRSQAAALTAEGNWWGTNTPASEISGAVDYTPSIRLTLTPTPASILADGISTSVITVAFNDGAGNTVPAALRTITLTASAGTLNPTVVTLNSAGTATTSLRSTITPTVAIITATEGCGFAITTPITFQAVNLGVSKTASDPPYGPGKLITYTIGYRNNGNATASGVVLTETPPLSTTFVGPVGASGWFTVTPNALYTYSLGTLAPGAGGTVTFVVQITGSLASNVAFTNVVRIGDNGALGPDKDPSDNIFTLTVSGGTLPDLWAVKNDNLGAGSLSGAMVGALANTEGGPAILELYHAMGEIDTQAVPEGALITYTIGYGNSGIQGAANASGVVLSDTLPLYTTYAGPDCAQPGGWCQVDATRTYTHFVGNLDLGQGNYIYFTVRVTSTLPSTVSEVFNTVCIDGAQNDLVPSNDCSSEQTPVISGTYDLSVTKVANATCLNPGDALGYQITVRNLGANSANNTILREVLPANTTAINLPDSGWTDAGGGVYTYSLGTIPSGVLTTTQFWVQINPTLPPSVATITNTVTIQANGTDSNPANNSFTLMTPLGTTPDLVITKNDNYTGTRVAEGGVISYTIAAVNASNRYTATNVVITETLPAGTVVTSTTALPGSNWKRVDSTSFYTLSLGTLGPSEMKPVENFIVQVSTPFTYGSEVVNQVQIRGAEAECDLSDNFATEETPVQGANAADLAVTKSANVPFCAVPGDAIAYTIGYTNNSFNIPAANVVLTETIDPAAVTFLGTAGWGSIGGGSYTRAVTSSLPTRASGTAPFDVRIALTIPASQDAVTNVVRIGTTTADSNSSNNVFTLTTSVPLWPDLIVVKNDNIGALGMSAQGEIDDLVARLHFSTEAETLLQSTLRRGEAGAMAEFVNPGGTITYTIILGNIGRATDGNVVLTETLPAGTTFRGPGYWHRVGSSNTYTYAFGALDHGIGDVLQFIVQVDNPFLAGSRVFNTVQIGGNGQECNMANNTSYEETPVQGAGLANHVHLPIIIKNYPPPPPTPTPTTPRPPTPTPTAAPPLPVPGADSYVADVAVDPRSHYVYVSSPRDWVLHAISGTNGANNYEHSFDIPVTHGATGLAVDSILDPSRVFVAHAFAPDNWKEGLRYYDVDVFNLVSYLVGPQFGYVGAAPIKVAANPQLHRAYVSNYYDKLAVIDTTSGTRLGWVKQKNYQGSWGIFVSPLMNWVHLATRDTGELVVFDGNGDRLLQDGYIPTHFKPPSPCALFLTAAHEATDHVFVTCPARKSVFFLVEPQMSILAAGELGKLELRQDGWVRVVQPQEVTWRELTFTDSHVSTNVGVWGIAVDRPAKRVYITDPIGDMLIVIQDDENTGNVRVVNYVRGPFDEPQGVAVDPAWQRVYVANAGNNTLTVLNALTPTQVISTVNLAFP